MTFGTIVPAFFIREKPTSSSMKPACMKKTNTAATMTQVVSTAGTTSWLSVGCKAVLSLRRESGQGRAPDAPDCRNGPGRRHCPCVQDFARGLVRGEKAACKLRIFRRRSGRGRGWCHTAARFEIPRMGAFSVTGPGWTRAIAAVVLALLVALGAAGCGGDSGGRLSKSDYEKQVRAALTDYVRALTPLQGGNQASGQILADVGR